MIIIYIYSHIMYTNILKNIKKLLKDRNYIHVDIIHDISNDSDEKDLIWIITKDQSDNHILVHLSKLLKSFKSTDIKYITKSIMSNQRLRELKKITKKYIFIIDKKISAFQKLQDNFEKNSFFKSIEIELISIRNLIINPIEHVITPSYRLLSKSELESFEDDSTCKKKNILEMIETDPIAVWYGAKRGNIFEIIIENSVVGLKQIKYRRVVAT